MALTKISTDGVKDDAVTAGKIPANAVGSSELADNAVDTAAIADDAVTAAKIADGAITSTQIANDAVTRSRIQNEAVDADRLAASAVTTAKLADNSVDKDKLAHGLHLFCTGSDKGIILQGNIGEIGDVTGFQAVNDAATANTDFGIRANTIRLATTSAERMRIDSSGRVGIGKTPESAVGSVLQTKGNDGISFQRSDESLSTILRPLASGLGLRINYQNGSEVLRIDSSGKFMVGGTTADAKFSVIDSSNPDIALRYNGTSGGHKTRLMYMDKRGVINAQVANVLHNDGVGSAAGSLEFATANGGTLSSRMNISKEGYVTKPDNACASVWTGGGAYGAANNKIRQSVLGNNNERWDIGNNHSVVSSRGRFTCPVAGIYRVSFSTNMHVTSVSNGSAFYTNLLKNGSIFAYNWELCYSSSWQYCGWSVLVQCATNDYLEIQLHTDETSATIGVDHGQTWNRTDYQLVQ